MKIILIIVLLVLGSCKKVSHSPNDSDSKLNTTAVENIPITNTTATVTEVTDTSDFKVGGYTDMNVQ